MKIVIAKYEPDRRGGGWTAQRNLAKGLGDEITYDYEEADVYFIAGASMLQREDIDKAKADGKKVVLRLDNMPRNSRNRNTGSSRLKYMVDKSDLVIYQSKWARDFLYPFTKKDGPVILNGVDTSVYNGDNRSAPKDSYLYARSSRDEGKQWIMAWYSFVQQNNHWLDVGKGKHPQPVLEIVGEFSADNIEYRFDFFNGEQFRFTGVQNNMAEIYRRNNFFLYSYTNDACSNTLIEARACGCTILDVYGQLSTGGAPEIMECEDLSLERMVEDYCEAIRSIL